jgi:hypothetical protein
LTAVLEAEPVKTGAIPSQQRSVVDKAILSSIGQWRGGLNEIIFYATFPNQRQNSFRLVRPVWGARKNFSNNFRAYAENRGQSWTAAGSGAPRCCFRAHAAGGEIENVPSAPKRC